MKGLLSDEVRLMLAPGATYRALAASGGGAHVARRLLTMALVIGGVVTLGVDGALTPTLFVSATLCWLLFPLAQAAVAAVGVAICGRRRRVSAAVAVDLFLAGHGPWSLWLLALTAAAVVTLPLGLVGLPFVPWILATALVPIVWTGVLAYAFCRGVLGTGRAAAVSFALGYEAATWALFYGYAAFVTFELPPFAAGRS